MKIIVSQLNARHRYLIPIILYNNNLLSFLFTNSNKYSTLGRVSSILSKMGLNRGIIGRLSKRDPIVPKRYVYSSDKTLLSYFFPKKKFKEEYEFVNQGLSKDYINEGLKSANVLYSMYFENLQFVKFAKVHGLKIVIDIYENPHAFKSLINEISQHPAYSIFSFLIDTLKVKADFREKYIDEMLELADFYTVPSVFVRKSLASFKSYDPAKVKMLPYPSSIKVNEYNYRPIKYRVIWVGNDPVRKGLIYCAKAAKQLKLKYPGLEFNVIGSIDSRLKKSSEFEELNFLGVMDKKSLIDQFETSEAYVFPTLFEGYAGTVLEAASCGCPIITTENSGVDTSEFPAIFIEEKNVDAIVKAVTQIFEDEKLRDSLSISAFKFSEKLSAVQYEKELVSFFTKIDC